MLVEWGGGGGEKEGEHRVKENKGGRMVVNL